MNTDTNFKSIIYRLVLDYMRRGEEPLRVKNILSIFTHPEVTGLRIEALLWLNNHQCNPDDIIIIVESNLIGYLAISKPQSGTNIPKILV